MLISADQVHYTPGECEVFATASRTIYWRGLVFKSGLKAGLESLRELAQIREEDVPRAAAQLKGAYFVVVQCKESGNTYAFVDPCGMYHAYYSPRMVGTSFLDISRREGYTPDDLDPEAVVEFFQFGHLYGDRTFFKQVRKIRADEVLCSQSTWSVDSFAKLVPDLSEAPKRSFDDLMRDFAIAVQHENVSVDITGGADSRLIAAALAYFGLKFEMATGGRPGLADIEIGAKVAEVLGRPFYPTYHSAARTDWNELVRLTDSMFDISKIGRLTQLLKDRKSRGITLTVSGACGELFREIWWMQDFPFYARRKPRLDRLFALRIAPYRFDHALLAHRYRTISEGYRDKVLRRILQFSVPSNGKSYDRVYYYFELPSSGGSSVTGCVNLLKVGLPYVDHEVIRIGYNLPPLQRVLNRFHRKAITRYSPRAAQLRTTEGGVRLKSGALPLSVDVGRYLIDRSKRLAKKIGQQALQKTAFQESSDDPETIHELARAVRNCKSTQILADHGVLDQAFDASLIGRHNLGRIYVLGKLFENLDGAQLSHPGKSIRSSDYQNSSAAL